MFYFVCLLFSFYFEISSSKIIVTIGGLFHENNSETVMAFKYSFARYNMFNKDIQFETNIKIVSKNDTLMNSKVLCNMLESGNGLAAIFGPTSLKASAIAESISRQFEIPHMQTNWAPKSNYKEGTVLNIHPDPILLSEGLAILVRHMNWRSYSILYENEDSLIRLQEVLKITQMDSIPVLVKQLGPGNDHRSILKGMLNTTNDNIILDCETDHILNILQQAKEVKMLDYFHSYIITSLDAHTLDYTKLDILANITTMRIVDPDNPLLRNAVRDWEQGEYNNNRNVKITPNEIKAETALMHDAVNLLTSTLPEIHVTEHVKPHPFSCNNLQEKWGIGLHLSLYMKLRPVTNSVTGPINFDENGRRVNFTLQIVQIMQGKKEKLAYWMPGLENLIFTRSQTEHEKLIMENLQKTTVIVSSRLGRPYLMERKSVDGKILEGNEQFEGYSMDLIAAIAKQLNFTFKFVLAEDGQYGSYNEKTKSWNGLIKDILDRKAHLAICDLTITHQRRSAVDFSMPFMTLGISILHKKIGKQDPNIFAFMDPLDIDVWVYTATLYLGMSILIYCIARMAPGDWENPHPCDENPEELENIWDLKNCLWLTIGSIMTQGCDILPKGISSRMGTSMWWFFSLIITSSYTANLAAFLTMERMGPMIDSAEALAKQTKIKYGTVNGGSTQTFFKDSNFSTYARMWTQMKSAEPTVFEKSNADGVKRVLTTKQQLYAFLMESSSIEYECERNCDLRQVGTRLDSKGYGIAMPFNAPYRGHINSVVLKLQEEGKLNELKNKWWKNGPDVKKCDEEGESTDASAAELALGNVGGVFLVLGVGVATAILIALLEFLWNVRKVSVEERMTYWEALVVETKFAIKVWITKKRAKPQISESSKSSETSENKSIAQKMIETTGSFVNIDIFDKISVSKRE